MRIYSLKLSLAVILILFAHISTAQTPIEQIDKIMQGDEFVGVLPQNIRWSADGKSIYFSKKASLAPYPDWYKLDIVNGKPKGEAVKIADNDLNLNPSKYIFAGNVHSPNYNSLQNQKVVSVDGDLYLQNTQTFQTLRLTNTLDNERNPAFTRNDSAIVYQKGNDLFYFWLHNGQTEQLTHFVDKLPSKNSLAEADAWLNRQQSDLLEIIRFQKKNDSLNEARPKAYRPKTIPLNGKYISSAQISRDGRFVVYVLGRYDGKNTEVPNYINQFGYTENLPARSKVGNASSNFELFVYDRYKATNEQVSLSSLPKIYDNPSYYEEYGRTLKREKPREVWIHELIWSPNGKKNVFVIRAEDSKDRWICQLDMESLTLTLLDHQHDDAWIGGEGISGWHTEMGTLGWLDDNRVFFQSERSGFSHVYVADLNAKHIKNLTEGAFEVVDVRLSKDKNILYVRANKENPHEYHLYRVDIQTGIMNKITSQKGVYEEMELSPDEKYWAVTYSYSNQPTDIYLVENKIKGSQTQLTHSTTEAFNQYNWYAPEIVYFKTSDGAKVPARIYVPEANKKNKAAVMFVHGAGYLQNVHYGWSSYFREYMFHNLLREQGYTVIDIDYRGSKGYGRDWRTAIYRHMGSKELIDYVSGADFLVKNYDIDADRIGIYGGSYGGFMTLMAMFNAPNTFRSGAALRSVTDWAHYNHPYTSNILNTPVEDSLAYVRSSPIYFAEGLKGDLLICHGMLDTNVQFQDVVRLVQRLIELRKENWELAVYPIEGHGFVYPTSWADEYKRIYQLFERTLKKE